MNLTLTTDERAVMLRIVETSLGETRVEAHRTHYSPEFREEVQQEERLLKGLLEKLRRAAA